MNQLVRALALLALSAVPVGVTYQTFLIYKNKRALIRDMHVARIQGQQWRDGARALLKGLAEAIDHQFLTWKLTEAEREVGLLIRKGLSLNGIAGVRVASSFGAIRPFRVFRTLAEMGRSRFSCGLRRIQEAAVC